MAAQTFGYFPILPEDIREIFMWLCQDVASLHLKWRFYLELFGSEDATRLLSELVLGSFKVIEESLRMDMAMSICRLSDPPATGRHENLSFRTLAEACDGIGSVSELLGCFLTACEPVRAYRNKRVGHNDLITVIKPNENPLPGIGKRQIDEILDLAGRILKAIYLHLVGSDSGLSFEPFVIGGADELLRLLRQAKQARETRVGDRAG
jgi:hypothetical protein